MVYTSLDSVASGEFGQWSTVSPLAAEHRPAIWSTSPRCTIVGSGGLTGEDVVKGECRLY